MKEIAKIPFNGFKAVSTFSGCGGSSLGYRMAGFKVLWANEFIPAAQEVYKLNHTNTILDTRDIRTIKAKEILAAINLKVGELDLLDGSPPCASFSTSGKRDENWGKITEYSETQQRTDDLFFQFSRILQGLKPKTFIAENVSGLVKGVAKGYFKDILKELKKCGYRVSVKLLDSQWLGVPQTRERIIFVGVREDLNLQPVHPKPLSFHYSVRDAFYGKEELPGEFTTLKTNTKLFKLWQWTVDNHKQDFSDAHKAIYGKESSFNHRRCVFHRPAPTIVQASQSLYHPSKPRTLTIAEAKRISTFPDDFKLTGTYAQQWERIGRAVPPVMMLNVANTLRHEVLEKL